MAASIQDHPAGALPHARLSGATGEGRSAEDGPRLAGAAVVADASRYGEVEAYESRLYGGTVHARPIAHDAAAGEYTWRVSVETGDGRRADATVTLDGQFGNEHLRPNSEAKRQLNEALRAQRTAEDPGLDVGRTAWDALRSLPPHAIGVGSSKLPSSDVFLASTSDPTKFTWFQVKEQVGTLGNLPVKRIETVHADLGGGTSRREDGVGIAFASQNPAIKVSLNIRGGDTDLSSIKNGATATLAVLAPAENLRVVANALERTGGRSGDRIAPLLRAGVEGLESAGAVGAVAWVGKVQWNQQTEQLELSFGKLGATIPVKALFGDLEQATDMLVPVNEGEPGVARANNIEAYLRGGNPYQVAEATRADGQYRNHGDPIADIAGRIQQVADWVGIDESVRTNGQAADALVRALRMDADPSVPSEWRALLAPQDRAQLPESLTPHQSQRLESTLALLEDYGIAGLYGERVAEAAERAYARAGDQLPERAESPDFVQSVFEGKFRPIEQGDDGGPLLGALAAALNANRWVGILTSNLVDPPSTVDETEVLAKIEGQVRGISARLQEHHGGILPALGVDASTIDGAEARESVRELAVAQLVKALRAEAGYTVNAETLYEAFREMPVEARRTIGEEAVSQFRALQELPATPAR